MIHKKVWLVVLCLVQNLHLTANITPNPWYKDGWKIASAGWAFGSACLISVGSLLYIKRNQLIQEKESKPVLFCFQFKDKEKLKLAKKVAPYIVGTGVLFAFISAILYKQSVRT